MEKEAEKEIQEEKADREDPQALEEDGSGLPKTQKEFDALIAKRLDRAKKGWEKGTRKEKLPEETQEPVDQSTELSALRRSLLEAKAQNEAVQLGISAAHAADAVVLALHEAETADELDEEGVKDRLSAVLKRHPEWKHENEGFRVKKVGGGSPDEEQRTDELDKIFGVNTSQ
jgi:hypothetical protein